MILILLIPVFKNTVLPKKCLVGWLVSLVLGLMAGASAHSSEGKNYCGELITKESNFKAVLALQSDWSPITEGMQRLKKTLPRTALPWVDSERLTNRANIQRGYAVDGVSVTDWQILLNANVDAFHWGNYSRPQFRQQMEPEARIDELFIATHVTDAKISHAITLEKTFSWFRKRWRRSHSLIDELLSMPDFQSVPRLILINDDFPPSADLLKQATHVQWSIAGEITGEIPLASTIHLVGEQFDACMSYTLKSIGRKFLSAPDAPSLRIVLHANHTLITNRSPHDFSGTELSQLFNLGSQLRAGEDSPERLARSVLQSMTNYRIQDSWSLQPIEEEPDCFSGANTQIPDKIYEICVEI